jgi:CHAD domain-containing protein
MPKCLDNNADGSGSDAGLEARHPAKETALVVPDAAAFFARIEAAGLVHWRKYRKAVTRCQNHFSTTSVHEVRVSMRRFTALLNLVLNLIKIKTIKRTRDAVKKQLSSLGELRDIQVQRQCIHDYAEEGFNSTSYLRHLEKRENKLVRKLRKKLGAIGLNEQKKDLISGLKRFRSEAEHLIPNTPDSWLSMLLEQPLNQVNQSLQTISEDPESLHRIRIAFKTLRYTSEALRPLLPEISTDYLRELRACQDELGKIQDLFVLRKDLAAHLKQRKSTGRQHWVMLRRNLKRLMRKRIASVIARKSVWESLASSAAGNPPLIEPSVDA